MDGKLASGNLVQVPEWMSEGAARYAARGLDAESENRILDACQTGAFKRLDQSSGLEAAVLGQAVWAYVADIYGMPTIANVLYMTRITRSVESGFRLATGFYLDDLAAEVRAYHLRHAPQRPTSVPARFGKPQGQANGRAICGRRHSHAPATSV